VAVAVIAQLAPAVGSTGGGEREDGGWIFFTRSGANGGRSSLWSVGADGSDLRPFLAGIVWADLRPHVRREEA
jgi:hypothetical protein